MEYSIDELMVAALAKEIKNEDTVHVGAGVPLVLCAAMLAKLTHAPDMTLLPVGISGYESRNPFRLTLCMIESAAFELGIEHDARDVIDFMERKGAFEPISPAQIDTYGNINNSAIGFYERPKTRLPGPAGMDALSVMPFPHSIYITRHSPRILVSTLDFQTAAGYLKGGTDRERMGLQGGPAILITNLAVLGFDAYTKGIYLKTLHPGVTQKELQLETGFPLISNDDIAETLPPSQKQLELIREVIDPLNIRKLEFVSARERIAFIQEIIEKETQFVNCNDS